MNTYKKLGVLAAFALAFLPAISSAESFKVTSPEKGDTYYYDETLDISWTPKSEGVSMIEIVSKNTKDRINIYGSKVYSDPVNYKGKFDYKMPFYLFVRPGEYQVQLTLEDGSVKTSDVFTIKSKDTTDEDIATQSEYIKYSFGPVSGLEKTYESDTPITFSISAFESKNVPATPENEFNIIADLRKGYEKFGTQSVNGVYNYATEKWDITFNTPVKPGTYNVSISLYCGNLSASSYCANKYGDRGQVDKVIKVKVVKTKNKKAGVSSKDHFLSGNMKSEVKVVTYSDIECPFCKGFVATTQRLIENYGDDVAFVYRHYPLTQIHPSAELAANATECVAKLGGEEAFAPYLHAVFADSPNSLSVGELSDLAVDEGVNRKSFDSCLAKRKYSSEVKNDMKKGDVYAKTDSMFGTPYSVIYDQKGKTTILRGNQPYSTVKDLIDGILE